MSHTYDMSETFKDKRIELSKAKERLATFLDAEDRIVRGGQVVTMEDGDMRRTVTRADAKWVAERINFYRSEIRRLEYEIYTGKRPSRGAHFRGI